ncbi:alpha/beta hydrolase [Actinokineospora diospyrosa]|uniref:TAP-like protein n=1 Tax=Actinokineospora diospyrosa TaxID=103728 RepID=A0ABT1IIV9_9PSEU|nr:alpha/beta hydrolase [Actinokineospora diospyrosa]MCP2272587.1 TAP-like protein [Actinokineospora diospyrosa]
MRAKSRVFVGVAAVIALVVGLTSGASAAQEPVLEAAHGAGPRLDWRPCAELPEVDCATLQVPVDWSKPRGEKIDLALARRKAADPRKRVGALVIHPGGPGPSGVEFAYAAPGWFSQDIQDRFDIVGFDPRGVGRSAPIVCSADLIARRPSTYPTTRAGFDALARYNRELAADCRARSGPVADHADSLAVVEDLDAIRRALGEQKINYYGLSYGTLVGQQYAERYGRNLRAMVIDSNLDHSSTDPRKFTDGTAIAAEDSFAEFVRFCDTNPACALHGRDVGALWDNLLSRADRGEITDPADPARVVSTSEIVDYALWSFYDPSWTQLSHWLLALSEPSSARTRALSADDATPFPFLPIFCQDWQIRPRTFTEYTGLLRRARELSPHMSRAFLGHDVLHGCVGLPDATNPQRRLNLSNAPKILMLNNLHDPSTGYDWAKSLHRQTRGTTVLLTYEGWGHASYIRTNCIRAAADRYLITLHTPPNNTHCAPAESPEIPPPSAKALRPALAGW